MTPAERVRLQLAAARLRGAPFEDAWTTALGALPDPPAGARLAARREAEAWRAALRASEPAFRRAYEREPATPAERAVEALA